MDLTGNVESLPPKHLLEVHRILFEGTRDEHRGGEIRGGQTGSAVLPRARGGGVRPRPARGSEERTRQAIGRLEEAGVLRQTSVGRRNRAWECVGLFDRIDRFERELGPAGRTPRPTR